MKPEEIVESGYDRIYRTYHERRVQSLWSNASELDTFDNRLHKGGTILDAGCGSGYVVALLENRGFKVTGIDISRNMLGLAWENAPGSNFLRMDMLKLGFPEKSFDGVICLYSIIHVPRRSHLGILKGFHRVLKSNGLLAIHMGWGNYVGIEENYLESGTAMYWSHFDKETNLSLISKAGFDTVLSKPSRQKDGTHLFVIAQKALASPRSMVSMGQVTRRGSGPARSSEEK